MLWVGLAFSKESVAPTTVNTAEERFCVCQLVAIVTISLFILVMEAVCEFSLSG